MQYTIKGVEKTNKICLMSGLSYLPFESNIDFLIRNKTNEKDIRVSQNPKPFHFMEITAPSIRPDKSNLPILWALMPVIKNNKDINPNKVR